MPGEDDDDFTYSFLTLLVIEVSEIGVSLVAISLPGLKPLIDKFILPKFSPSDDGQASLRSTLTNNSWRAARPPSLAVQDSKPALGPSAGFEVRTVTSVKSPGKNEGGDEGQGKGINVTSEFCVEAQDAKGG
ncbi:proteinrelated to integral membrane protein pth11 [Ophiocordyceps camponoti-floridani]|uniref:Proteinrelated to integral membrane protein pth11 n=1 Tax=Ophiocordyceps camponoti-floridani TaxID=2030778 RepID=A0A8H4VB51_9HYPO|nr:proteinrelated to integral membrane protein pth11 [Ophiocordyceps camponoti-floridani]